jgi:hypothetical protein
MSSKPALALALYGLVACGRAGRPSGGGRTQIGRERRVSEIEKHTVMAECALADRPRPVENHTTLRRGATVGSARSKG